MNKKKLKIIEGFFTLLIITGVVFSNVPYNVLTGLINSYEKTNNIVDKIWNLEQNHDSSVVDKFASVRSMAEKFKIHSAMAAANYQGAGTWTAGTTALTVPWPTHAINDVALLFIENANSPITLTTPAGFVEVTGSPQSTGTLNAIGAVRHGVYWARATSTTMASPVVAAATNHQTARILTFRGIIESGNPWDATPTVTVKSTASTTNTFPSITTTVANDVIVLAAALDLDATSTTTSSAWANANLTGITERTDQTVLTGVGGGLAIATGLKATVGATSTSTSTVTSTKALLMTIALKPQLPTTTLSNFVSAEQGNSEIAPADSFAVDSFGLMASVGTDTVTAVTVGLAAGMGQYIQTVAITNDAELTTYCSGAPTGDTASLTGCTLPVTTTNTQFKINITADPHTSMPAPPGGTYGVTATVTGWTGTNATHAGTDSGSGTVMIDNLSPGATTGASATPGDAQVQVGWTNPADADFQKVIIYCKTSAITESPTEGTDPAVDGTACDGTARVKYSGTISPQTFTGLTNGQIYYFRIYARDINGNFTDYTSTQQVSATPVVPPIIITLSNFVVAEPGNFTIAPGASAQVDSFGIVASAGPDTLTNAVVTMTTGMGQYISNVALTNDGDTVTYCNATPSGDIATFTGCTLPITTTNTQFKVRLTAKSHALMPAPAGGTYAITGTVTSWTVTGTKAGSDSGSSTMTIDNLSPDGTTGLNATSEDARVTLRWSNPHESFQKLIIYCKTSAITEIPTEGTDPAVDGAACDGTARVKYSGDGTSPQPITGLLNNGTIYYFRIYARDTNGNFTPYATTEQVSAAAAATSTLSSNVTGEPGSFTIAPGASWQVDSFGLVVAAGTDTLTGAVVTLTTGMGQYISNVALTDNNDTVTYCNATPSGDTATFTGCTLPITTTNTQFKVRLTAKSHILMPVPPGGTYATTGKVTSFTVTGSKTGTDSMSSTVTIDNLSPGGTTNAAATSGNSSVNLSWTNSVDSGFNIVYCKTSAITESPTEGTNPAVDGAACDGTARVKYSGYTSPQTFSGLTNGTTYYYRIYARDTNGNFTDYASTQQVSATPDVLPPPTITSYTNTTESGRNYATSCTDCGARIGYGSSWYQSITITGTNFDVDPGSGNRSTAINNIKVGTHQIGYANVRTWSPTSITFWTDTSMGASDTEADWGTNFGGANALTVTTPSGTSTGVNFYVFPQITSLSTYAGYADAAREYGVAGDSGGTISLSGSRFGSTQGSGSVSILGQTATILSWWENVSIDMRVPSTIPSNLYSGSIIITGSNGKTSSRNGFRILPRITSISPSGGPIGTAVTINGDHLCQSGTCPVAFTTGDKVTFASGVVATTFISWSDTAIVTEVPVGAVTGNVFVTSNTSYNSNNSTFTISTDATTIGTGSDPAARTIAPGGFFNDVNTFTLQTNGVTESIASVTVNLSDNTGIYEMVITDNANTVLGSKLSPSTGSNVITVSGMSATSSLSTFKVRIQLKDHSNFPLPPGGSYAITAPITAWAGINAHAGSDTNTNALTVDNLSPANVTAASGTAGNSQVVFNWTNPGDADLQKTIIIRHASTDVDIMDVPAESLDGYIVGNSVGTSKVACVVAPPTSTCTDSGLTNGTTYYYKIFTVDLYANWSVSGVVPTGSPFTPLGPAPTITSYTNTTETTLNSAASCTSCGARIGSLSKAQSITITGTNYGTDPGSGNYSTATNNIKVGTHQISSANVTAWSATSITFLTDSAITGDTDASWGTNFGGASALTVTAGSQASVGTNFYIFPQITSISTPSVADAAREYDAGDSNGVITLNGTRFGTALGSGSVSVLGSTGTTTAWGNTAITIQVPTAISDSTNTGSIILTQGTGSNGKTSSYNGFRILPRITSLSPSVASIGEALTVNGNHLCQTGTCPGAFSLSNKVTFTTATDATVFTSWSHTAIVTAVPNGSITGTIVATTNSLTSNSSDFTLASAIPNDPTNISQFKDVGFTQSIAIGGMVNIIPIYLKMTMEALISGGTIYPQVEYKPIGTPFVCTGTFVCADAVTGTGVAGPGPTAGSVAVSPTDGSYHWQARVKHTKTATDYYSAWVSFGGNGEDVSDFIQDATPPVVSSVSSGTPGTNGATISWLTSGEISTTQLQYNKTGTFVDNCATNNDCTSITNITPMVNSHSVALSNLNSGTSYSYRVRSKDAAGNETIDTTKTFSTQSVVTPLKTIKYDIGSVSSGVTSYFRVDVPEDTKTIKNAFIEVLGMVSGGLGTVTVKANNVASRAYDVNASNPTFYRFLYQIPSPNNNESNLNTEDESPCSNSVVPGTGPMCNNIIITPSSVGVDILSAKIIINYSY